MLAGLPLPSFSKMGLALNAPPERNALILARNVHRRMHLDANDPDSLKARNPPDRPEAFARMDDRDLCDLMWTSQAGVDAAKKNRAWAWARGVETIECLNAERLHQLMWGWELFVFANSPIEKDGERRDEIAQYARAFFSTGSYTADVSSPPPEYSMLAAAWEMRRYTRRYDVLPKMLRNGKYTLPDGGGAPPPVDDDFGG